MKIHLKHGEDEVTIEADDDLMDRNPWFRESFQQQVQYITDAFYGDPHPTMKDPRA